MKKLSLWLFASLLLLAGCNSYDDDKLWDKVNELDSRLTAVEQSLSQMNSNVTSLQTIVNALKSNVYITDVTNTSNGYIITFSDGSKANIQNGTDGVTPHIGGNGNWWIGTTDTGIKAAGSDGDTPYIGDNGNWWFGTTDTGKPAVGKDGLTPFIGANGNWWIGTTDTGTKAVGSDGITPHIGANGNWWIGTTDTGISVTDGSIGGSSSFPIIGVDIYNGIYYWTQTIDGSTTWLLDLSGNMIPVGGYTPIFKVDITGYIVFSYDGGVTWINVYDYYGQPIKANNCDCTKFFQNVYVSGDYLYLILIDGTEIKIRISGGETNRGGIPEDPTTPDPNPGSTNVTLPYANVTTTVDEWGNHVATVTLTGIQNPYTGEWLTLYGTGLSEQNVWISVDGSPKGILVVNLEDNTTMVKNDIVFTVDNSGSMGEEANAIANGIQNWASMLTRKGLDVRFGVVGFGGNVGAEYDYLVSNYGVTGAMDFASSSELSNYLNRANGTNRTKGYYGSNASALQSYAGQDKWSKAGGENGAQAIRFANEYFNFRPTANRIYVNFTDDCNFTGRNNDISVEFFKDTSNWPVNNGTIHSVISNDKDVLISRASFYSSWEHPWLISEYTGGTTMFVKSDASDLQLDRLTVSEALTHSYTIKFIVPDYYFDGLPHTIRITVISTDGTVRGVLEFTTIFGTL